MVCTIKFCFNLTKSRLAYIDSTHIGWGEADSNHPPGISGDNAYTRLCLLTNFLSQIQWNKKLGP